MPHPKPRSNTPRQNIPLPPVDESWRLFANAITEIHNNNAAHISYEESARHVYNLCIQKHGSLLYDGVCGLIRKNLHRMAKEFIIPAFPTSGQEDPLCRIKEGEILLKVFRKSWDRHISNMTYMQSLLVYMDNTYVTNNNLMPIYNAGLDLFIEELLRGNIQETIIHIILELIHVERDGYSIDRSSMKGCIDVFLDLGSPSFYASSIEPRILEESAEFYDKEREVLIQSGDIPYCLHRISNRIIEEESRSYHYLSISHPKVRDIVYQHLIIPNWNSIVRMGNTKLDVLISEERSKLGEHPDVTQFYDFLQSHAVISFRPEGDPVDDHHPEFNLLLDKETEYDALSAKVGKFLKMDPKKIRLTVVHPSNALPGTVLTPKSNFIIQEILRFSRVYPIPTVILYRYLDILAIFFPCIHVKAICVFWARTHITQTKSHDMPIEEVQKQCWESIRYSSCNCPWRVLLDRYKIYPLLGIVNNPWELFDAIRDWFDDPEKKLLLNQWRTKEAELLMAIIEHIISVIEPAIKKMGGSSSQISLCFSWLRKIIRKTGVLPNSLVLKDVKQTDRIPIRCGGFADIYKGTFGEDQVALKLIRITITKEAMQKYYSEVFHEALHWKCLRHEHIVPFLGITQDLFAPLIGLVSPWMTNGSILQYLENNPQADRGTLLTQSANGLKYLHNLTPPLVHGDIKAANILVDNDDKARLTDFGLISFSETQRMQTTSMMIGGGSLRWMAPELIDPSQNGVAKSRNSDIYAFGMTIIEVFTGSPPFSDKNDYQVLFAIISGIRPARPNNALMISPLSDELWEVAQRCWDTDPERRPTAEKLLSDLQ